MTLFRQTAPTRKVGLASARAIECRSTLDGILVARSDRNAEVRRARAFLRKALLALPRDGEEGAP